MVVEANSEVFDAVKDDNLEKIIAVKKHILGSVDRNKVIDVIRKIIDDTDGIFKFISERKRKFIDVGRPALELYMDIDSAVKVFPYTKERLVDLPKRLLASGNLISEHERSEVMTSRSDIAHDLIVTPYTNFIIALFKFILNGKIPDNLLIYEADVLNVIGDLDRGQLKLSVNNIIKSVDSDDEGFLYSVISSYRQNLNNNDILVDTSVTIELML